jgi:DNA-nicking Smr family endonuclease
MRNVISKKVKPRPRPDFESAEQAKRAQSEQDATEDARLFRETVGAVQPLKRSVPRSLTGKPAARARLQYKEEAARKLPSVSDDYEPPDEATDEPLFYIRPGANAQSARKLRRGAWKAQAYLDLHGMRLAEARLALADFLAEALALRMCCVRIIHGKGFGSPQGKPILKAKVRTWLTQYDAVLAFCQAAPHEGGAGAVVVLLTLEIGSET